MKREDPKRVEAAKRRDRAQLQLEILASGIGHAMQDTDRRYYPETMRELIKHVNEEFSDAVDEAEAANKAYEPYWKRTRYRRVTVAKAKKPAKKKVAVSTTT